MEYSNADFRIETVQGTLDSIESTLEKSRREIETTHKMIARINLEMDSTAKKLAEARRCLERD